MKNYKVNVNGNEYEIGIKLIDETDSTKQTQSTLKNHAEASAPATNTGVGESVNSPMPGTILSVNVKNGDAVKKGQVLMILEAMKMENEIMACADGTVTSVMVNAGQAVEAGAALCTIG